MKMPVSRVGGAQFRGPTSSEDYNQNEEEKYLELVELYKQSNLNLNQLAQAQNIVLAENAALHGYVSMLEQVLTSLEKQMNILEGSAGYDPVLFKTGMVKDMQTDYPNIAQNNSDTQARCDIDTGFRHVTLPLIHKIPKTHMIDETSGDVVVPSELNVKMGRTNTKGDVTENSVYNAFNGDNISYWQRSVAYSFADAPAEEDVILEIELPSHLVSNLEINTIQIHPHPERGIQVKNIEIHYQNAWQTIEGFIQDDLSAVSSSTFSPRKRWHFKSVPVQRIRITLVQKNPLDIDGKRVFILGAQEIGVSLYRFEPNGGIVLTPIEMDGLYNIESVEHIFLNRSTFGIDKRLDQDMEGRVFEYEILKETHDGVLIPVKNNEWSGQYATRLWIKTRLMMHNGINPCLHAIRLNYSR